MKKEKKDEKEAMMASSLDAGIPENMVVPLY